MNAVKEKEKYTYEADFYFSFYINKDALLENQKILKQLELVIVSMFVATPLLMRQTSSITFGMNGSLFVGFAQITTTKQHMWTLYIKSCQTKAYLAFTYYWAYLGIIFYHKKYFDRPLV